MYQNNITTSQIKNKSYSQRFNIALLYKQSRKVTILINKCTIYTVHYKCKMDTENDKCLMYTNRVSIGRTTERVATGRTTRP